MRMMRIAALSTTILIASPGWPGWDWNAWKEVTGEPQPEIESPQTGTLELIPLLSTSGKDSPHIETIRDWETKRDRILARLRIVLGEPTPFQPVPPYAEILDEEDLGDCIRRRVRVAAEPDDWVPAYYLLPKPLPTHPIPTMIVIHQTVPQGKDEPCGIQGDPELAYGVELVRRGYVVLAPDMIGFGERIPKGAQCYTGALDFYRKHPKWSFFGKMSWDMSRLVDWLETQPEVDMRRIGCMGHSHGAYSSIMGAIFEPRISLVVASCGFNTLRTDPTPNRWCHLTALMPRLGYYVEDIQQTPFDWHEIISCLAPRPYFNWATLADAIFPNTENLEPIFAELRRVYGLYGAADLLKPHLVPGPHSFPREGREGCYSWLKNNLPTRPDREAALRQIITPSNEGPDKSTARRGRWEQDRKEMKQLLLHDIGPVEPLPWIPSFQVLEATGKVGYSEEKIEYTLPDGEVIRAYLLKPPAGDDKKPGMLVFHQTVPEGKEEPAGHSGKPSLHFGPELARRGYAVLIPDSICTGERTDPPEAFHTEAFYRRFPGYSAMGKMIQDGRMALDLLCSLPEVDVERIGTMGHSLGAEEALFVAAFDDRVKAAVASCGFAPFRTEKNPDRWARDQWFSYMPRLRVDLRAGRPPAWDMDDVIRLVAPRGYFNCQTTEDEIFPESAAIHPLIESLRPLWRLYGAEERLRSRLEPGPHSISDQAKSEVYDWLDGILHSRG